MGRNLLLNFADHGFSAAGYDKDQAQVNALVRASDGKNSYATCDLAEFIGRLQNPRNIILLVPAGKVVDSVIAELLPYLAADDLIIDSGNSYYKDTDIRSSELKAKRIHFLGMGISGGEEGARHGPSLMPGGPQAVYERVRPALEAVAAKVNGVPCVTWLGPGSAGHFVKMVHNGMEYGLMQLLTEAYDLMKRGLGMDDDEMGSVFKEWNTEELNGYLMEITGNIFSKRDRETGKRLIDEILDVARQKGTGMWTSQSAMELHVPVPTIDIAVAMRDLSVFEAERTQASALYPDPDSRITVDRDNFPRAIERGGLRRVRHYLCARHGFVVRRFKKLWLQPQAGIHRPHLARRMHHPGRFVG